MTQTNGRKIPRRVPVRSDRPLLPPEEIARRQAESEAFAQQCREIFWRVYPELVKEHYDWFIYIEPKSGDYFIDPDREAARQKARQKHPHAQILAKRLNETGCLGRI